MMRTAAAALLLLCASAGASWVWEDVETACADPVGLYMGNADGAQLDGLAVAPDGSVHLVWCEADTATEDPSPNRKLFYNARAAGTPWNPLGKALCVRGGIFAGTTEGACFPSLACDGAGALHLSWHDYRDCAPPLYGVGPPRLNVEIMHKSKVGGLGAWDIYTDEYVTDWPNADEGGTLGDNRYMPALVVSPAGALHCVFADYHTNPNYPTLAHSTTTPGSPWPVQTYEVITPTSARTLPYPSPAAALDAAGVLHVVSSGKWNADSTGGCYYIAQDGPGAWTVPLRISGDIWVVSPKIAIDALGNMHVVWAEKDAYGHWDVMHARKDVGENWQAPVQINGDDDARMPDVAADSEGGVHITYRTILWGGERIAYRYLAAGETGFTAAWQVSESEDEGFCAVVVDGTDAVHCAWSAEDGARIDYRRALRMREYAADLPAGWSMVALPLAPQDAAVATVFADAIAAGNALSGSLFAYEAGAGYRMYPNDFTRMELGQGYWLRLSTPCINTFPGTRAYSPVEIDLAQGWNLIGHPRDRGVPWADCLFTDGVETLDLAGAVGAGWLQEAAYYYDGAYRTLASLGGDDDSLRPPRAYWVLTYVDGLTVLVP